MLVAKDPADMPEIVRTELVFGPMDGEVKYFPYPGPSRLEFETSESFGCDDPQHAEAIAGALSQHPSSNRVAYRRVHKHYFVHEPYLNKHEAGQ